MKKIILTSLTLLIIASLTTGCTLETTTDDPQTTSTEQTKPTTLKETNREGTKVYYEGTITISGKYREYQPNTLIGGTLCFYPDDTTKYLIPRSDEDTRKAWFCFQDQDSAKKLLGINDNEIFSDTTIECIEGLATIEVSDYTVDLLEAAVFDKANLKNVISKESYSKNCQ